VGPLRDFIGDDTEGLLFLMLKVHPNVICLTEWRWMRERRCVSDLTDEPVRFYMCLPPVDFVGWRTEPADTPPERPRRPYRGFGWFRRPNRPTPRGLPAGDRANSGFSSVPTNRQNLQPVLGEEAPPYTTIMPKELPAHDRRPVRADRRRDRNRDQQST